MTPSPTRQGEEDIDGKDTKGEGSPVPSDQSVSEWIERLLAPLALADGLFAGAALLLLELSAHLCVLFGLPGEIR
jgi:hypothetical protein